MMVASCHCGAVRLEVARRPRTLTSCNCSICRRYGALWAYYEASAVRIVSARGAISRYSWGEKDIAFCRCTTCGCVTHHERTRKQRESRMAVNARHFEPGGVATTRIRRLDGAATWKYLD